MFRILQLQRSIRRFTSVGKNVAKITSNHQPGRFYSSALAAINEEARATQSPSIQAALMEIQNNLKRWGRISNKQVLDLSGCVLRSEHVNSTQALAVIRCFTDLSIDMKPKQRIRNVQKLWEKLERLCVHLEVGHYNALLRAYLDSEHSFSPTDFLAKMAENGVGPNRVTYQFLVERYCQTGDVDGASRIMKFMEEKDVPITQGVLNLMIMGHARNNDMESAEKVIDLMESKGLTPDESTYGILLAEYARKGDVDKVVNFFKDEKYRDIFLDSRTITNIVFEFVANGHSKGVPQVLQAAPAIIQNEFHRLIHRLVSCGRAEECLSLLEKASSYEEGFLTRLQNYVVTQFAQNAKSVDDVARLKSVVPEGETATLYMGALKSIFANGNLDDALKVVSEMQTAGVEMRTHMFFPLIARLAREKNAKDLAKIIVTLKDKLDETDTYTVYKIFREAGWGPQPAFDALLPVRRYNVIVRQCLSKALAYRHFDEAVEIAARPFRSSIQAIYALTLIGVLWTIPVDKFVTISSHLIARGVGGPGGPASPAVDDVDANGETPEPDAAVSDAADELEGKLTRTSFEKLMQMTPQQLNDFIIANVVKKLYSDDKRERIIMEFAARKLGISKDVADKLAEECPSPQVNKALKHLRETKFQIPERSWSAAADTQLDLVEEYLKYDNLESIKQFLCNRRLVALCEANDSRAPEVFKESGNVFPSGVRAYIRYACNNDISLGKECWRKYSDMDDADSIFLSFATKLLEEGNVDDALEIVSKKQAYISNKAATKIVGNLLFALSNSPNERCQSVLKEIIGESETVHRTIYNSQMNTLIDKEKFEEAVDLYENSGKKFGRFQVRKLAGALVDKEKYELLQRLQHVITSFLGEDESLFELSLVLLKCRKDRQAKRIIELSGQPNRVIQRVLSEDDLRSLESLLEILPTFHPRKDEICERVVHIYDNKNDAENALALYTRFEQENYTPSHKTLSTMKRLFLRCGYEVPFDASLITDGESAKIESAKAPKKSEPRKSVDKVAPEQPKPVVDVEALKKSILQNLDSERSVFQKALYQMDVDQKNQFIDELVMKAIEENNVERMKYVLPSDRSGQFNIFMRVLKSPNRDKYVAMMENHVDDLRIMLQAYWFEAFLKGEDKVCEELWLKHGLFDMICPTHHRSRNVLRGHEERHYEFFKKINAPPGRAAGSFIALARKNLKTSPEAAVEFLEKNAEMISHCEGRAWDSIRVALVKAETEAKVLRRYDELMKTHGVNVTIPES